MDRLVYISSPVSEESMLTAGNKAAAVSLLSARQEASSAVSCVRLAMARNPSSCMPVHALTLRLCNPALLFMPYKRIISA